MELYLDSAHFNEIIHLGRLGLIQGVTTNPSLIKKAAEKLGEKPDLEAHLRNIFFASPGPVSVEVISTDLANMHKEAVQLVNKFGREKLAIKIPICTGNEGNWDAGLELTRRLSKEGVKVNSTLIFTPQQAMLAASAGAYYVSPFAGRLDDVLAEKYFLCWKRAKTDYFPKEGKENALGPVNIEGSVSGVHLVERIANIFSKSNYKCKVLAASIRNPRQVIEMAEAGADIATVPYDIIVSMTKNELTYKGVKSFENDTIDEYRKLFENR